MITCDNAACPGHLGVKFSDCLTEALYGWSGDQAYVDGWAGDVGYEGHVSLFIVESETEASVAGEREQDVPVHIPAGNYLLWADDCGFITLQTCDTADQARTVFDRVAERHAMWEAGCDPGDPAGHAECSDFDTCQVGA